MGGKNSRALCEGAAGLLHTLALTALLTWSAGVDQAQDRDSGQQDSGSLHLSEPTAPSRQPCPRSPRPSPAQPVTFPHTLSGLIHTSPSKSQGNSWQVHLWRTLVAIFWLNEIGHVTFPLIVFSSSGKLMVV